VPFFRDSADDDWRCRSARKAVARRGSRTPTDSGRRVAGVV